MSALLLAAVACGGSPVAATSPVPSRSAAVSPSATASSSPSGSPEASPSAGPAAVSCGARPSGGPMVLLAGLLYDVTDPVHPRRLCSVSNSSAHIWTGDTITFLRNESPTSTAVVLHSIGSGNESVAGHIPHAGLASPGPFASTWWAGDATIAATTIPPAQSTPGDPTRVWVYSSGYTGDVYSYPYPLGDCICTFGIPPPTLAISPDRAYLVAGWPFGKGAQGLAVYRLSDRSLVKTFDTTLGVALWDRTGHRLYLSGLSGSVSWTPEGGQVTLAGAQTWQFLAGLSPDASQVAYTAYLDNNNQTSLRVFVYDVKTDKTRMLRDALRGQVVFVKPGWVWYLEETTCNVGDAGCGPTGTKASGKVQAMNLADGVERQVDFLYAEDTTALLPGEFWPSS
jgi:hypothetical protein